MIHIHRRFDGVGVAYRRRPSPPGILRLEARVLATNGEPHDERWWPVDDAGLLAVQQTPEGFGMVAQLAREEG